MGYHNTYGVYLYIDLGVALHGYVGHDKLIIILGFVLNKLEKKRNSTFDVEPKPMIDTLGPLEASCEQLGSLVFLEVIRLGTSIMYPSWPARES